ncbi:alpha/beta fold hydrolase [Rubrivirga sp. IMCC45206]|uniref:alpha/beta fold hydrolase n=1 Tax=Rubrivirga sp. IMCC45206 TaxID=3391614 RepID=UPI00398FDD67
MRFLILLALCACAVSAQPALTVEPTTFETADGRTVAAEVGRFSVPENRARPDGRTIELAFVRFASTNPNPGPPIVYLAGGPGGSGSGTARGSRFDLFQDLRAVADVIAFDQRGTGLSNRLPGCPHTADLPVAVPTTRAAFDAAYADLTRACESYWRRAGVDLAAYTTAESADDLEALRRALGADQISLWAISYGTHLALAAIRRHPASIARAVLAGVEGPDHTIKRPSDQQALLEEIDRIVRADDPGATFLADIETVLDRLRERPVTAEVGSGVEAVTVGISAFDVQRLAAGMLGSPEWSMQLPAVFAAMRDGDFSTVAPTLAWFKADRGLGGAMSMAMDAASGASLVRRAELAREARETLLGNAIAATEHATFPAWRTPRLGPDFRAPVVSDVPALFISGTLDGRTPVRNADEVRPGFSRHAHLVIDGAGHSDPLFLGSPIIGERIRAFLAGEPVASETIPMAE